MTRSGREIHARLIVAGALCLLSACASAPPPLNLLRDAEAAIATAREARAEDYAPVELGQAQESLAAAREAVDSRDNARASDLAEQAELDASLATARSRAAAGREAVTRGVDENARLRRELLGNEGGPR
jgi:hypothetical protein